MFIGRGDHFRVAHGTAGLDHGPDPGLRRHVQAVPKGKERIRGHDRARQRQFFVRGLLRGDARAVDAAHLARADAERHAVFGIDDRV